MTDAKQDLIDQCKSIALTIETGEYEAHDEDEGCSAYDYLQDALDIEYVVSSKKEYLGARVLVAFGGPNIWINTRTKTVDGAWWGDSCSVSYHDDALGLDEALADIYSC